MVRPNRLYKTTGKKVRYYYIVKGKRRYIKVPPTMSQRQVVKINIKNVLSEGRRIKRRKKRVLVKYEKPIIKEMQKVIVPTQAPVYFFQPEKKIVNVGEESLKQKTKDAEKKSYDDLEKLTKKLEADTKENQKNIKDLIDNLTLSKFKQVTIIPEPEVIEPEVIEPKIDDFEEINKDILPESTSVPEVQIKRLGRPKGIPNLDSSEREYLRTFIRDAGVELTDSEKIAIGSKEGYLATSEKPKLIKAIALKLNLPDSSKISSQVKLFQTLKQMREEEVKIKLRDIKGRSKRTTPSTTPYASPLREEDDDFEGRGASIKQGLYNDQIENVLKRRIKDFVPVIPSDKTSELLKYVQPNMKRFGFIINTNPSTSDGSGDDGYREGHWRSCFINNEDDFTSVEYFDPLASGNPEKSLIDSMKQIAKKMNPEKYFLLKINRLKRQPNGSASCGWHAIQFLDKRFQSIPWDEATGYNQYIEKNRPSDTTNGEKEVKKYFEKYKSYI